MNGIKVRLTKNSNHLKKCEYTMEEEIIIYDTLLEDIYNNPRWYLDNLHSLPEFRLSWGNYRSKKAILPYKYVEKPKPL